MVEEGQPEYIEQAVNTILRRRDIPTKIFGKGALPMGGEYTAAVMAAGVRRLPRLNRARGAVGPHPRAERAVVRHPRQDQGAGRNGAGAPARLLHRLPGAADLCGDEAGREGARRPPRRGRYRLPSVFDPAALQYRRDDDGLWPRPGLGLRLQRQGRQEVDLDHGRRRLLAQRPDQRHRQCRLQQARRRHHGRRQFLFLGDRRPGHPVVARRQHIALDPAPDRQGGQGRRRNLGAPDRSHL